jgi:ATP-dependent DNA helicase RecG
VRQRAALSKKGAEGREPHVLVMTATPIPRTLALTLWGDLDLSIIDELPPGRIPVKTELLRPGDGQRVMTAIREVTGRGEQVYVVYPLVEESEKMDLLSAVESAQRIAAAFPDLHVEIVHGQLTSEERNAAMARFKQGESHILVSTTVIEVGVDVPNASLMVIEHAERFGLAQLHQLRGRVGRGQAEARCMLFSRKKTQDGEARLKAMLETTDGFKIADADLKLRGPGEFLGTQQSGRLPELRLADLLRDARLIPVARESAFSTLAQDPGLARHPQLASAVQARWGDRLALSSVG